MPTYTQYYDAYGRLYEYDHYQNGSTCTSASNSQTLYRQWTIGEHPTVVANSPYVIDDWRAWNTGTSTYCTVTSNQLWEQWCTTTVQTYPAGASIQSGGLQYPLYAREPTPEELATQKQAEAKRAKAKVRAKSLLDSVLSPEQRQYVERHGYIPVIGSKGRRYHIRTTGGASGNVAIVDDHDGVIGRFCVHPGPTHDGYALPTEDQFVAQLLHIQDDEDDFLGKANLVEGKNPVRRALSAVA